MRSRTTTPPGRKAGPATAAEAGTPAGAIPDATNPRQPSTDGERGRGTPRGPAPARAPGARWAAALAAALALAATPGTGRATGAAGDGGAEAAPGSGTGAPGSGAGAPAGDRAGGCGDFLPPADGTRDADLQALHEAVEAFVQANPRAVADCAEVAEVLLRIADQSNAMGAWRRAGEACDRLRSAGRLAGEGPLICAQPRLARGDLEGARALLAAAVRDAGPEAAGRLRVLRAGAALLESRARPGMAADLLGEALALSPADADLALRHLRLLLEAGRHGDAVRAAEAAVRRFARDRETLRAAVLLLARHDRGTAAASAARALLRLGGTTLEDADAAVLAAGAAREPDLARAAAVALRDGAEAATRPAAVRQAVEALRRHGQVALAAEFLGQSLREAGTSGPADLRLLGALRAAAGDREGAEAAFEESLQAAGGGVEAALEVAREWQQAREPARAAAVLRRAMERAPGAVPAEAWMALGRALHDTGDAEGEQAAYRDAAVRSPDPAGTWMEVAEHLLGRGDARGAAEAFRESAAAAGGADAKARALAGRGEALLASGAPREAVERALREALDTGTREAEVLSRVERVASRAGEDRALRVALLEAAVRREPSRPDLWARLALARLEAGRPAEAARDWGEAVDRAPDRAAALADGVGRLVRAGALQEGLGLAQRPENRLAVTPALAQGLGEACLALGDAPCAARYLRLFLAGPMALDHDYEATGRALAAAGLHDLALQSLERAARVAPPDRRWELEVVAGRVLALAGRWGEADGRFLGALEASGHRRGVALRVARELLALGGASRALPWLERAAAEPDPATRLQAVPIWVESLARLGRGAEIPKATAGLAEADWRRAQPLQAVAVALANAGRDADAAALLRRGTPTVREDERAALGLLEAALWLRAGRVEEALAVAREACEVPGEEGDARCAAMAERLEAADRPDLALELLRSRVARGGGSGLRADLAVRLLRAGDREGALRQALALAGTAGGPPAALWRRLGEAFRGQGLAAQWREAARAAARGEGGSQAEALLDEARTLLSLGDVEGATRSVEAFLAARRGGEGTAWRAFMDAGFRDRADGFVDGAPPEALAALDPADLQVVAEERVRAGRTPEAVALLDRFRAANEGVGAADEAAGRILADLGLHGRAVEVLSGGPSRTLSDEARAALVASLWRLGRRDEALSVALAGLQGDGRKRARGAEAGEAPEPAGALLAFFLAEGGGAEALALLDRWLEGPAGPAEPALRVARARLRLRVEGAEGRDAARQDLRWALARVTGPVDEVTRYVRDEVRDGTGASLAEHLAGIRGTRAAEALLLAACLSGRRDLAAEARARLAGDPLSSPSSVLAAARALMECGRWEEAAPLAQRALESWPRDRALDEVLPLAVAAARSSGRPSTRAVEAVLSDRIEGPAVLQAALARARQEAGDGPGEVRARMEAVRGAPAEPGAWLEALEAALRAGDEAARRAAEEGALAAAEDRPALRQRLAELYQRRLREDLAADVLSAEAALHPGDAGIAGRVLLLRLAAGDGPGAARAAEDYGRRHGDPRAAAADVVSAAARHLDLDLAGRWLPALRGPAGDGSAAGAALLEAAVAHARAGRLEDARVLAGEAGGAAPDPVRLRSRAAQAVLQDPEVPAALAAWVRQGLGLPADAPLLPSEGLAGCGDAADEAAARACARAASPGPAAVAGLLAAADRALASGRWAAARGLHDEADRALAGSAVLRRSIASRLLSYLGEPGEVPPEARRMLAEPVLAWIEADPVPRDGDGGALQGHLAEMARGLRAGVEAYEREMALAPSEAGLRNNLAYLLSMAGGDLERAQREARLAVVLSPRGAPWYLETEAWARFLRDGPQAALPLQERARRTWTREQGGGAAEGFWHLGRMLEAAGRRSQAREAYRRAAVGEPSDWSGVRALRRWRQAAPVPATPR